MEDTHYFVTPKFNQMFFCVLVRLLSLVAALEDFADIAHVEHIMRLSRGGQELLRNTVKQLDSCNSKWVAKCLDFFREAVELCCSESFKNAFQVLFRWVDVINNMELGKHTWADFSTTTTWFSHSSDKLKSTDFILNNFVAIIPASIVNPLAEQFDWRLCTEGFLLWHVQVINKAESLKFGAFRLESILSTSVKP
jgi:hypothetical protein